MPDNLIFIDQLKKSIFPFKDKVKRRAQGELIYDYLVPAGYYQEQWDWDGFFIGIALSAEIPSEAIYLRNWALNYIRFARKDGYSPGCVTPKGPEKGHRVFLMKPFIAQGSLHASISLKDFSWIKPHYSTLKKMVNYREKNLWSNKYDLGFWTNGMESGADDNVAAFGYPDKTVIACDLNSFIYKEYQTMSKIAKELGYKKDSQWFAKRAEAVKKNMNKYLWNEKDAVYYNLDSRNGESIKRISYSCFIPLWAKIATSTQAKAIIKKYLLSSTQMLSKYGIRTLSKQDKDYNNVNRIHPYSNWQGPIWPIAHYFYTGALLNYGFAKEAFRVVSEMAKLVLKDIQKTGGMHENYDAETGKPLAAPNFISWNLLIPMIVEHSSSNTPLPI